MTVNTITVGVAILQFAVLLVVCALSIRFVLYKCRSLQVVFFTFAIASALLSNIYWVTYDILIPDKRMPFAANEIAEWATLLLYGSSLMSASGIRTASAKLHMFLSALLVAANTVLWIAWSGEWIQDILTGLSMGYFFCCLVYVLKHTEALNRAEWTLTAFACCGAPAVQAVSFFVPGETVAVLDIISFSLIFSCILYFFIRMVAMYIRKAEQDRRHYISFLAYSLSQLTMYMSSDSFYTIALISFTLCFPLMFYTIIKENEPA